MILAAKPGFGPDTLHVDLAPLVSIPRTKLNWAKTEISSMVTVD